MSQSVAQRLSDILITLPEAEQKNVLAFAEFLHARVRAEHPLTLPLPELLEPPQGESVVAAIKRLSRSYAMLDKTKMLGQTAELMTQHVVYGRTAEEIIPLLETLFMQHYQSFVEHYNKQIG
ncbi:hypothetical protein [Beggiatoa leptomitoformis]|uniref:Crp/Fnr family transcriptional regulator n=1 Tax=Beggiatoa leptomitoformis TaxID=288004 RepID=A0A2N9YAW1_9GAMM|nr:hypothetical protein [Beggiatoa leptomitoformis]ALG67039.2 Crp/Fnr family transcriptional regulator [Beggiatoa leptomitoformis]AUI67582.1 Crp/Fnr family transcriptional regulator [Beggiatoa leptomitoformis]